MNIGSVFESASFRLTLLGVDVEWLGIALDHFAIDHDLFHTAQVWQLEHRVEQDTFHDRTQSACTRLPGDSATSNGCQSLWREVELNALHVEQLLILFQQGILGLCEDLDQRRLVQVFQCRDDWQTPDEFRDQAEALQIFGLSVTKDFANTSLFRFLK